jgi:hypothetical protein
MPPLALNVGFQGQSRSNADITEPSLLTQLEHEWLARIFYSSAENA